MKKKTAAIAGIIALSAALMGGCGSSATVDDAVDYIVEKVNVVKDDTFREDIAGSVGDHIIYSYNLFENRGHSDQEKKDMLEYLEKVDKKLNEDIFVTGFTIMSFDGSYRFYARQCGNGAVVKDIYYATDIDDPSPNIVIVDGAPVKVPDTTGLIPAEELFDKVKSRAEVNSSDLCDYHSKGIYGDYLLCYDMKNDLLVYDFTVNDYSHVILDAKTGDLVEEDYFNGDIPD